MSIHIQKNILETKRTPIWSIAKLINKTRVKRLLIKIKTAPNSIIKTIIFITPLSGAIFLQIQDKVSESI